jgi:hypothetical protein
MFIDAIPWQATSSLRVVVSFQMEASNMRNAMDRFSDDVLADIFRYLLARSLCLLLLEARHLRLLSM